MLSAFSSLVIQAVKRREHVSGVERQKDPGTASDPATNPSPRRAGLCARTIPVDAHHFSLNKKVFVPAAQWADSRDFRAGPEVLASTVGRTGASARGTIEPGGMRISRSRAFVAICVVCCTRMPGALAAPFADGGALKTAVTNCLANVTSGSNCCSTDPNCADPSSARCGAAGCDNMPSWDTSLVTDMGALFRDCDSGALFCEGTLDSSSFNEAIG